jgi:hypothetical protein
MSFDEAWLAAHQARMASLKSGQPTAPPAVTTAPPKPARHRAGVRPDLGPIAFRSAWEANYARYLNLRIKLGEITRWQYEPETFWFLPIKRGVRSYKPDFKVWPAGPGEPYYIELKGHMDKRSATKLKRMRIYYPDVKVVLVNEDEYRGIARSVRRMIPTWE